MKGTKSGSFMGKVGGVGGVGLQVAAMGKDMAESAFQNAAAQRWPGHARAGGRHVVVPPRGGESPPPAAASTPAEPAMQPVPQETPAPPPPRPPDAGSRGVSATPRHLNRRELMPCGHHRTGLYGGWQSERSGFMGNL